MYAIVHVGALHTSVLTLLITVIAGRAIGLAVRYVAGSASQRPRALDIAGALGAAGLPVTAIRRVRCHRSRQETHRATTRSPPRETAAGWTWSCMTGTSRRPAPSTGCIGGCGCSAGVTQRTAVGGPRGRAPGPAVLRGRGRGRAHAAAARPDLGRSRSLRAGLRAPRGEAAGPAGYWLQRRRAQPDMGGGRPAACPQGHAPGPDCGSHPAHRRRPGHAARPGRWRRGSQRPADPPGRGPAHR